MLLSEYMELAVIAAVSENGVIGSENRIPWQYERDMQHFEETTFGHPVIMGRKTFDSITTLNDGPLDGRLNIVLTRNPDVITEQYPEHQDQDKSLDSLHNITKVVTAASIEESIALASTEESDVAYVAGGESVYKQFIPLADEMVLSRIPETVTGDAEFPEWNEDEWEVDSEKDLGSVTVTYYDRVLVSETGTS